MTHKNRYPKKNYFHKIMLFITKKLNIEGEEHKKSRKD